ncbi:MAG: hydrogenase, partial [Candidatus Hydrogenedentes bacterium]|nr:hydrogenase [Candidatus Hydrogenedentota bacterium]
MAIETIEITTDDPTVRAPLVTGDRDFAYVTNTVCDVIERPRLPRAWYVAISITLPVAIFYFVLLAYLFGVGIGVWGVQNPVSWGFAIVNFVFWIGIGHAGTLSSAILFLFRQKWRTGINRSAEAITIFALPCAGLYPIIHIGCAWLAFYLMPYPNERG